MKSWSDSFFYNMGKFGRNPCDAHQKCWGKYALYHEERKIKHDTTHGMKAPTLCEKRGYKNFYKLRMNLEQYNKFHVNKNLSIKFKIA